MKKGIAIIATIAICLGVTFGVKCFLNKDIENQKDKPEETINKYGTVEKENIMTTVSKFNAEVKEHGSKDLNPAMEEFFTIEKEAEEYWYGLHTGIYLFGKAEEFTGDKENDITNYMGIYYYKEKADEQMALEYVKHLIKANNNNITDEEVEKLIKEGKELAPSGKTANNGKGISVGILEKEDNYQYQVIRLYK